MRIEDINFNKLAKLYIKLIKKGKIPYISYDNKEIPLLINNVIKERKIENICELWKALFDTAMSFIDESAEEYDKIHDYIKEFCGFEELLYSSSDYYRDHILHSISICFLAEYFYNNKFTFIDQFFNSSQEIDNYKTMIKLLDKNPKFQKTEYYGALKMQIDDFYQYRNAIICVAALTHDLGYPLEKTKKINESINRTIEYYSINNCTPYSINYSSIDKNFTDILYTSMSCNRRSKYKKKLTESEINYIKNHTSDKESEKEENSIVDNFNSYYSYIENNDTIKLTYINEFENFKHGIVSAFLLVKIVPSFASICYKHSSTGSFVFDDDVLCVERKKSILKAISDHTNNNFFINQDEYYSSFICFLDELEEFSRLSRYDSKRQFGEDKVIFSIDVEKNMTCFEFRYADFVDSKSLEIIFKEKDKRMKHLFKRVDDLPNMKLKVLGKDFEREIILYENK